MIRNFSKCGTNLERIMFLRSENGRNCSMEELKGMSAIMSFDPANMDKFQLIAAMIKELEERSLSEALELNCTYSDMDAMVVKEKTFQEELSLVDAWALNSMAMMGVELEGH